MKDKENKKCKHGKVRFGGVVGAPSASCKCCETSFTWSGLSGPPEFCRGCLLRDKEITCAVCHKDIDTEEGPWIRQDFGPHNSFEPVDFCSKKCQDEYPEYYKNNPLFVRQ